MEQNLQPQEDYRHILEAGEHEAFHFLFTSSDGGVFGYLRLLFGRDDVLEVLALRIAERTWVHQQRVPCPAFSADASDIAGDKISVTCETPWEHWRARFEGQVTAVDNAEQADVELSWEFNALTAPTRYRFGPSYQQSEQEGTFKSSLKLGSQFWEGLWTGGRDHSWGRRPMGAVAHCTVLTIPERLYTVMVDTTMQPACFGHWIDAAGEFTPVVMPKLVADGESWYLEDAKCGSGRWAIRRLATPLIVYYGNAGEEDVRSAALEGDLLRDEIAPALFISPTGEKLVGFLDLLWGLKNG